MDLALLLAVGGWMSPVLASAVDHAQDDDGDFIYDYESLRIGGLVFAAALFIAGIALVACRKCSCSKSEKPKGRATDTGLPRV